MIPPVVSKVSFRPAPELDQRDGLLGWVLCVIDRYQVDGITVRRQLDQRLAVVYPSSRGRGGEFHPIFLPIDASDRLAIGEQILAHLGKAGHL